MQAGQHHGESTSEKNKETEYNSDLIVDLLRKYEIEYIAANIGSTFRALWDSLINYGGDRSPKTISCCHEEIAVAIAHGYAKATGKPMVAIMHDTVGLLHATMAIYNAWCDRAPIIILGASGPMDPSKRRPWIDWIHSSIIPNNAVRDYVKWDDFAFSMQNAVQSFIRAYNIATTEPAAPVFVSLDTEYLEEKIGAGTSSSLARSKLLPEKSENPPPTYPSIGEEDLERVARLLLDAESPFLIAGTVGRNKPAVRSLIELAEVTASRVFDTLDRFNFPSSHYLDVSEKMTMREADTVLALDTPKLELLLTTIDEETRLAKFFTRPEVRIAKVGLDELLTRSWAADYQGLVPVQFSLLADTSRVIPRLTEICREIVSRDPSLKSKIEERSQRAKINHEKEKERWQEETKRQWNDMPISLPRLASEVRETIKGKPWVIANGSLNGWARKLWNWEEAGCYLGGSGGAGLGYGLPASVGAALAYKNSEDRKLVIDFQADGDFLFTSSSLWTAAHYRVPLLIIMFNNRVYFNDAEHNRRIALSRGRDSEVAFHNGGDINDPVVDFGQLARSQGVYGDGPIERPEEIAPALEKALRVVENKREPALVDIVTKAR